MSINPFKSSETGRASSYLTFIRNQIQDVIVGDSKMINMNDGSDRCKKMSSSFYSEETESSNKLVRKCRSAIRVAEMNLSSRFKTKLDFEGNMWVMRIE